MLPFFPVPMDVGQQGYVEIRAEERVRTGNDVSSEETELKPQLRYDAIWQGGMAHFMAYYNPRFILTSTFTRKSDDEVVAGPEAANQFNPNDKPLSVLHQAGLGLELQHPRWRLSAYQFGAYGPITTTGLLAWQPPWAGEGPPPDPLAIIPSNVAARFTLLFLQTMVLVPIRLSSRVSLTPRVDYNGWGGADSTARATMPYTSGPGASLALEVAATKYDRFTTTIGGGFFSTSFGDNRNNGTTYRAEASETYKHWFSRVVSSEISVGGSYANDPTAGAKLFGTASAGLYFDDYGIAKYAPGAPPWGAAPGHGDHLQVAIVAKASPWIDNFSGDLEQRAVGLLAINYSVDRTLLRAQVSAAKVYSALDSVAQYSIFQVEGGLRYRFSPTFSADGGVRFGTQNINNAIRYSQITQVTMFAGLTWAPLPARF
ncbi:MAG: hypothetical protein FWD73_07865 [Polyangiaceae bacterium]|nr:hypothetical protein [Polyangiaceae bacterium]